MSSSAAAAAVKATENEVESDGDRRKERKHTLFKSAHETSIKSSLNRPVITPPACAHTAIGQRDKVAAK